MSRLLFAVSRGRLRESSLALLITLSGCVMAPGLPGGPLQGTGAQLTTATAFTVAKGNATLRSSSTGTVGKTTDYAADAHNGPLIPTRIGMRIGLVDWMDIAGDAGWFDSGAEVRVGIPEGGWILPIALGYGVRRGGGAFKGDHDRHREQRVRLELYPRLFTGHKVRLNLVGALGMSWGRRFHELTVAERFDDNEWAADDFGTTSLSILRDEWRLEAAVGAEARRGIGVLSVIAMPYWVTAHGPAEDLGCYHCSDWALVDYHQTFGFAIFASVGISFTSFRFTQPDFPKPNDSQ